MKMILIQIIPLVALILWTSSYHFKARKGILGIQMLSCIFWTMHFALLGAKAGTFFCGLATVRLLLFSFKKEGNWISHPAVLWAVLTIQSTCAAYTIKNIWEIFSFLGVTFAVIASWQDNPRRVRKIFVPSHIMWIVYDLFIGSWGGAISEAISGTSTLIALMRKGLR